MDERKELQPNLLRKVLVHIGGVITIPWDTAPYMVGFQGVLDSAIIIGNFHPQFHHGSPADLVTVGKLLLVTRVMTHTLTYGPRFWDSVKNRSHGKKD